jgi:hypothetical protein
MARLAGDLIDGSRIGPRRWCAREQERLWFTSCLEDAVVNPDIVMMFEMKMEKDFGS